MADQQTDRSLGNETDAGGSIVIRVPTSLRHEEDVGITTDAADSIYNQNYSIQTLSKNKRTMRRTNYLQPSNSSSLTPQQSTRTYKSSANNSMIVGHCQAVFQPLDPKLLIKPSDKSLLAEHQHFYSCSPSFQISVNDSGFFDDQASDSLSTVPPPPTMSTHQLKNNLAKKFKYEHRSFDNIFIYKSEEEDDVHSLPLNSLSSTKYSRTSNMHKQQHAAKRVSFQD